MPLAMAMASSSVLKVLTVTTGPKTSSWQIWLSGSARTVGCR